MNLRKISKKLQTVLAQKDVLSKDWDKPKIVHSGKYGYLNMAINYQEILEETKLIKQLVKSFNISGKKIWKYRDAVFNYNKTIWVMD